MLKRSAKSGNRARRPVRLTRAQSHYLREIRDMERARIADASTYRSSGVEDLVHGGDLTEKQLASNAAANFDDPSGHLRIHRQKMQQMKHGRRGVPGRDNVVYDQNRYASEDQNDLRYVVTGSRPATSAKARDASISTPMTARHESYSMRH